MSYLGKELEIDLEWRLHEIEVVRRKHSQCANDKERRTIVKCLVLMLYAHWEGFVKNALTAYLEAICRTGVRRRELTDNLIARSLQATLNRLSEQSIVVRAEIVGSLEALLDASLRFEQEGVNTKSNLKTHVFRGLLDDFGLYLDGKLINELTIDTLVDRRNDIAHGTRSPLEEIDKFLVFYAEIRTLMEALAVTLDASLDSQSYKKPSPQTTTR